MLNLLIFCLFVSIFGPLHGLEVKFEDPVSNYSLLLEATSISGLIDSETKFDNTDLRGIFIVSNITRVWGKVYSKDLSEEALSLEIVPQVERGNESYVFLERISRSGISARQGSLGVYMEFLPIIWLPENVQVGSYPWVLYLNFHKQNATAKKMEAFELYSYGLKSCYWNSSAWSVNVTKLWLHSPVDNIDHTNEREWYADSQYASNFMCSKSTLKFSDVEVIFKDLRVSANLNAAENNTEYAVCVQDCAMKNKDCLIKGENCTSECPEYTLPAPSSATSTYTCFIFSFLPIILLLFVV